MRILVVEDEHRMAALLRQGLTEEGHVVNCALNGPDGFAMAATGGFDLIILDVMLPGMSGLEVAKRLRANRNQTPILLLTARDTTSDIVQGLDVGADDYLTKPFSYEVLLARVRAVGRRGPVAQSVNLEAGGLSLMTSSREVRREGQLIELTRTEYAILELLMRNTGRVVTRDSMIESVWGGESDVESNTIDSFVRFLRAKVETPGQPRLVRTVRGVGYILSAEPE